MNLRRIPFALLALCALTAPLSAPAMAEPDPTIEPSPADPAAEATATEVATQIPVTPDDTRPAVSWRQLGLADKIVVLGSSLPSDVEMPMPPGISS
ncbi:MAG: hypothetical protein HY239_09275, partial [Mycolicibacterium aromaticivorans]|nr:hypothetical protein [Mycolicibacterium aromaticivorans]